MRQINNSEVNNIHVRHYVEEFSLLSAHDMTSGLIMFASYLCAVHILLTLLLYILTSAHPYAVLFLSSFRSLPLSSRLHVEQTRCSADAAL